MRRRCVGVRGLACPHPISCAMCCGDVRWHCAYAGTYVFIAVYGPTSAGCARWCAVTPFFWYGLRFRSPSFGARVHSTSSLLVAGSARWCADTAKWAGFCFALRGLVLGLGSMRWCVDTAMWARILLSLYVVWCSSVHCRVGGTRWWADTAMWARIAL